MVRETFVAFFFISLWTISVLFHFPTHFCRYPQMGVEEILVSQPDGAFPIAFVSDAVAQTANSKHIETLKS